MTKVINLYGGSGLGKSTTAALLFGELKLLGKEVELVQEYAKEWAWEGRKIGAEDQERIGFEQWSREARLYGKVDYIITDSPLLLGPVYQAFYTGKDSILENTQTRIKNAADRGVSFINFRLARNKPFNPKGRFETEDQAKQVDAFLDKYLAQLGVKCHIISSNDRDRVTEILSVILEGS